MSSELRWGKQGVVEDDDNGKGRDTGDDLGDSGPSLGADSSRNPGIGPAQGHGPPTRCPQTDAGRHHFSGCAAAASGTACRRELGDDSTIHRTFQRWVQLGVLERIWSVLVKECEELGGVEWEWQAVDCAMGKARFGGIQSDPTPRTGPRQAASGGVLVDGSGGPLSVVVAGANVHDTKLLRQTLENIVVAPP